MTDVRTLPVAQLMLDTYNPRLHHDFADQRAILEALLRDTENGPKIIALAEDISKVGLNPADLPIVTSEGAPAGHFVVLEGNRRLAALRLLSKPALGEEVLSAANMTKLREFATAMQPITTVTVLNVDTRAEADHWIELRHGGEMGGTGIVRWDGRASDRWRTRHKEVASFVSQVLDFLQRMGALPDWYATTPGRFPTTTLDRLLIGAENRAKFGLSTDEEKRLVLLNDPKAVVKAFAPIIEDLATSAKTVSDLKRKEQREKYVKERVTLPGRASVLPAPVRADTIQPSPNSRSPQKATPPKRRKENPPSSRQTALIAKSANLQISQGRINDIYHELQGIEVAPFPNSVGVLFRVFLELSIDHYIKAQRPILMTPEDMRDSKKGTLAKKIGVVHNHMKANGIMDHKELAPVRRLTTGDALFDSRVTLMNGFVHNSSVTPKATELKTEWNDLLEFFRKLWP